LRVWAKTMETKPVHGKRGGRRIPGPGKKLGRPPKIHHAIQKVQNETELLALLDDMRKEAARVIEGMAAPERLANVVDAVYKLATGYNHIESKDVRCPKCQAEFQADLSVHTPPNVKAQMLWLERVAGKVPQTTILRDPAREQYVEMMRQIQESAKTPALEEKVIDTTSREV